MYAEALTVVEHPSFPGVYTPGLAVYPGETEPRYAVARFGLVVKVRPGADGPTCACCGSENLRKYRVLHGPHVPKGLAVGVGCARKMTWNGTYLTVAGARKLGLEHGSRVRTRRSR